MWTEEDDRMWKRTKPYECEICGERGSTRVRLFSLLIGPVNNHRGVSMPRYDGVLLAFFAFVSAAVTWMIALKSKRFEMSSK